MRERDTKLLSRFTIRRLGCLLLPPKCDSPLTALTRALTAHLLRSKAESWRASGLVKNDELGLEENITKNGEANASVWLDTTEASLAALVDWGVVDVLARDGQGLAADHDVEIWDGSAAWEGVSTLLLVQLGAGDLLVVGVRNLGWEVEESGASVGNGAADVAAAGGRVAGADGVATSGEAPESLGVVDWDVGDASSVLGAVDVAEVVRSSLAGLEIGSEELLGEAALDGVEESGLLLWLNGVDAAESQTEETVVVGVLSELGRNRGGSLDSLRGGSHTSNNDLVGIDNSGSARAITVGDVPSRTLKLLCL